MGKDLYSPIVISGPSGAGKSVLINYIEQKNSLFLEASGCTTRQKRENETGRMYFLSKEEFEILIEHDQLIEYCIYNGNYYGCPKSGLEKLNEKYMIFNVGYSSAKVIKEMNSDAYMIYLMPPHKEELIWRIGDRGSERYRLGIEETMKHALYYEYLLISQTDNLEATYHDFLDIVNQKDKAKSKRLILAKNRDFIRNYYK